MREPYKSLLLLGAALVLFGWELIDWEAFKLGAAWGALAAVAVYTLTHLS